MQGFVFSLAAAIFVLGCDAPRKSPPMTPAMSPAESRRLEELVLGKRIEPLSKPIPPERSTSVEPAKPRRDDPPTSLPLFGVPDRDAPADSRRVLLVVNSKSSDSRAVAGYYAAKRKIPSSNVLAVECSAVEQTTMDEFKNSILEPIRAKIKKSRNPIDFIVLTKGIPIRIRGLNGYSVDGQLVGMNLKIEPIPETVVNLRPEDTEAAIRRCLNPYAGSTEKFDSSKFGIYLVTRLDGYTVGDAKHLVDNSLAAKAEKGPFFFDAAANRNAEGYRPLQRTLYNATSILKNRGFEAETEDTPSFVAPKTPLAGYASWGSNDGKFDLDIYHKLKFKPGALCETFVSTSARTFQPSSGGQSLIADLISQGVTGVKGYVSEPYVFALAQADIIFDRYTSGFNLAESFYAASAVILWKDLVIGDPLCRPYKKSI